MAVRHFCRIYRAAIWQAAKFSCIYMIFIYLFVFDLGLFGLNKRTLSAILGTPFGQRSVPYAISLYW